MLSICGICVGDVRRIKCRRYRCTWPVCCMGPRYSFSIVAKPMINLMGEVMVRVVRKWLVGVLIQIVEVYENRTIEDSPPVWSYLSKTIPHIGKDLLLMDLLVVVVEMFVLLQWRMTGLFGFLVSMLMGRG